MAERWNATVGLEDDVWHLGDFAVGLRQPAVTALLSRLHGRKHLVTGNNDPAWLGDLPGWSSVQPYAELQLEGTGLVLCHYAFRSWRNMGRGWLNLHGHSHGRLKPMTRQVDVGVDVWDFRPVTLPEIMARKGWRKGSSPAAAPDG